MAPAKLTVDPVVDLEGTRLFFAQAAGCEHIRVRKRGDLIILESGSEDDPVAHARLRRVTSQWWTLEMGITGKWSALPPGHKAGKEMLVREVSMLIKLAQSLEE